VAHGSDLYAGGKFDTAGGVVVNSITRWDGSAWHAMGQGLIQGGVAGVAYALTIHDGELVVGGLFQTANGVPAPYIARFNGLWHAYPGGPDRTVHSLAVYNGELIAGGEFSPYYSGNLNRVARWNGSAWQNLGPGVGDPASSYGIVTSLAVSAGRLFVIGEYTKIGAADAFRIARWNGASWETWPGDLYGGSVAALTEYGGELIAGGVFTLGPNLARFDGTSWHALGPISSPAGPAGVGSLAVYNGELVVGGTFALAGGVPANGIARWNGTIWQPLGAGVDGGVAALTVWNGELIVGGSFSNAGGAPAQRIAKWNGTAWLPMGSLPATVNALAVWNGALVAGHGGFAGVRSWNGSTWVQVGTGLLPSNVHALGVYAGELIAGGGSSDIVAKWNGTAWSSLGLQGGGFVEDLVTHGGELFAAGQFWNGGAMRDVAAWNGVSWQSLEGGTTNGDAFSLASYGGALILGGNFGVVGLQGSPLVARWSSPLALVRANQPGGNGSGVVIENRWLVPGHEYFNIFSTDVCAGGPGTGPYGGLCSNDFSNLVQQALLPLGAAPFHYLATGSSASFGPYPAPIGLTLDVLCIDSVNVATGNLGCLSAVSRWTVY
jgi:hypothetical protein